MASHTPIVPDIEELVRELTFEEKVSLLSGKDFWVTNPVERLGIPSIKYSDGPNGARGALFKDGLASACFPASVSLAATFDKGLVASIGKALAEETRTKGASVLLGPTVCPHRDPRGGRNFESFSEDPFLAGELASEYIRGLQQQGIGATIKHYAANEQETKRFTVNACLSQRALREIYIKPFEIAIKKSDPWAVMTSYNAVNGTHSDMNEYLIERILRNQWGFQGLVVSDWGGTNSTVESLNAGLDLEMPGPGSHRTLNKVHTALENGEVSEKTLNARVQKNLEMLVKAGKFMDPEIPAEAAVDRPEHRALIRKAGAEGVVLLKNEASILPLQKEKLRSIALLGLAKEFLGHGGGSASVNAHHKVTPYHALEEALGDTVELKYALGADIVRNLDTLKADVVDEDGNPGFTARLHTTDSDRPTVSNNRAGYFLSVQQANLSSVTFTGSFTPSVSGNHYISFVTVAASRVTINEEEVFGAQDASADVMAFLFGTASDTRKQYHFVAGQSYAIKIEATALAGGTSDLTALAHPVVGFSLGFAFEADFATDLCSVAVEKAQTSDVAILFVGNTPAWETEGYDRDGLALPKDGSLDRLVSGCASVNPNTIVVNMTGSPISMPWVDDVKAVVQAWFPGQEAGYAITDALLGRVNPGGKLPVTFPKRIEDAPTYGNFPGSIEKLQVDYKEDIFIGYRHYDQHPETVLFPFGYGLSYTTFDITDANLSTTKVKPSDSFDVSACVHNTGSATGSEVLQVYVGPAEEEVSTCPLARAKKILAGWVKIQNLKPGDKEIVSTTVSVKDSMSYWDEAKYRWIVPKGSYIVYIGTSSAEKDVVSSLNIEVLEEGTFEP